LNAAYDDLIAKEIPISPFTLKKSTIDCALEFLTQYGLSNSDEFIVLHLREEGYYDSYQHKYRNVNIENYNESIDWLLKQGLKVVRIGHSKMTPLEPRHGFIDLTISERPSEVDIYLCAKAKFYYGSSSGPYSISFNFNVPSLLTSLILYGPQRPNNLIQFLPLKNKVTGKILSIKEIKEKHLNSVFSARVFDKLGLEPIFPSSESNLLLVKEMIEYLDKGKIYKENVANRKKLRSYDILGGLCSESLSLLT
jgi:putative glycosyltransferase (TIGR04372 family)